jgi:hypothetical protein
MRPKLVSVFKLAPWDATFKSAPYEAYERSFIRDYEPVEVPVDVPNWKDKKNIRLVNVAVLHLVRLRHGNYEARAFVAKGDEQRLFDAMVLYNEAFSFLVLMFKYSGFV